MAENRLEKLRELVNTMIISDDCDPNELLKRSQELDKLIIQEIKGNYIGSNISDKSYKDEFNTIINSMKLFDKMYDSIRLVDPVKKEVLEHKQGKLSVIGSKCYSLWEKNESCGECVSIKAYNEDEAVFKLEKQGNRRIYLVMAVPVCINERKLVAEILKDVSDNLQLKGLS